MLRKAMTFGALAGILLAGFFVSQMATAQGSPPPPPTTTPGNSGNNPGSPGDNCSHGNSGAPCKPDPQPGHGKECDDHGNASGNEDHCLGTTTGTTPCVTNCTTTSGCVTNCGTTTSGCVSNCGTTTSGCVTNCGTTSTVGSTTTTTLKESTTTTTASGGASATSTTGTATPKPKPKSKSANEKLAPPLVSASAPVELPNTGLKLPLGGGIGAALLFAGLLCRRLARQEDVLHRS